MAKVVASNLDFENTAKIVNLPDPSAAKDAATKDYADTKVAKSGDTMTGALTLPSDPTAALHAATKQYVDSQVSSASPKRHAADFGNASDTEYTITHNLGTKDLHATIRRTADDREVIAEVDFETANTVVVRLAAAPGANALRIVLIG
ncbi:MAG: hypothetical protein QN174_07750 [Armatimonadota bacterium]|nr:hypothetical protein [Armatimonadota bacterium]